jgi:F0F1-type ATP synthase membrane subunit b/b'
MNVIIGTRGSKLALAQAEYVKNRLQKHYPQNSYELKIISTKGDREQKKALDQIGDKGLFVREIEQELLDGTISLAVHSMKDMPAEQPSGLVFAHAWKREDPRDVLILREAVSLEELPQHAVIGTGSRRRAFQLLQLRKDLRITGIRGNVDTRIKKMQEEAQAEKEKYAACQDEIEAEKNKVLDAARASAREEGRQLIENAQKEADKVIRKAGEDARREKDKMLEQAKHEILSLVLDAAAGSMNKKSDDSALYDEFLKKAGTTENEET